MITPAVLVVSDQSTLLIRRQSRLTSPRKAKENSDVSVLALVGR